MNISAFIKQSNDFMRIIQEKILEFLENDTTDLYENIILFDEQKILEDKHKLKSLLYIISAISKYHFRTAHFFDKLEYIINLYKGQILKTFTNLELFDIFKNSKRFLLFLFEEKFLIPEKCIFKVISQPEYVKMGYIDYFIPEFSSFIVKKSIKNIELFNEKRKSGENDSYISQLIRNDSIIEFITYVNKTNLSLSSEINFSIFETNLILLKKENISLIEYASFYGSFQIFKYLQMNGVKLHCQLWNYAIHGKNPDLFHFLERFQGGTDFFECYLESIKCHHIDFMNYIKDNLLTNNIEKHRNEKIEKILIECLKYYNFYEFINNCENISNEVLLKPNIVSYFVILDYYDIVSFIFKNGVTDMQKFKVKNIFKKIFVFLYEPFN